MAHTKHQTVRARYDFCCGYCGISETDAGGELTVDHFHPMSAGGGDSDDNLVYACIRCNLYKGALTSVEGTQAQVLRLLHPLRDNINEHLHEDEATGRLESLSPLGAFHINALQLNRDALVAHRLRHRVNLLQEARYAHILAENTSLRARLTRYKILSQSSEQQRRRSRLPKNREG